MILKLRTSEKDGIGWKLIDCIQVIEYEYMEEPENIRELVEKGIQYINTYPNVKDKRVVLIRMTFEDRSDLIYTDDIVYVLNNNGNTCDTINV